MNSNFLIYYLFRLIKDGHEWQYKNLNGTGEKPRLYFSFLQFIAIFISILFVVKEPCGLSSTATDYILGCLSIMVALFLSLILVVFDKSKQIIPEESSVKKLHSWNFFYQFNALTSYAILLSVLVIVLIIIGLIFNIECDLSTYSVLPYSQWDRESITTFGKCTVMVIMRTSIVYFLIDFFIICLYAICSIYQFIRLDFLKRKPDVQVFNEEEIATTFKREYGFRISRVKYIAMIVLLLVIGFVIWTLLKSLHFVLS